MATIVKPKQKKILTTTYLHTPMYLHILNFVFMMVKIKYIFENYDGRWGLNHPFLKYKARSLMNHSQVDIFVGNFFL